MPPIFRVVLDPNTAAIKRQFKNLSSEEINRKLAKMLSIQTKRLAVFARNEAPGKKFPKSIKAVKKSELSWYVAGVNPPAEFILSGTRPHIIRAKNARCLAFEWEPVGGMAFFKSVKHPGTKPNKFTERAFKAWWPEAQRTFKYFLKEVIRS